MTTNRLAGYLAIAMGAILAGCSARKNYPGVEYAPQMYHSVPYEPLTQITDEGIPSGLFEDFYYQTQFSGNVNSMKVYNDYGGKQYGNAKYTVAGTVKRQYFPSVNEVMSPDQELLNYNYHKDSLVEAALEKNPLMSGEYDSAVLVADGKELYTNYCSHCHGEKGDGKGKVGEVYKGVANFQGQAYKDLPEGHIFHVITHGKGRMWSHKSQLNPEERWKVVMYVQQLQKGN